MLVINYNGNKPTADYFKYSVQGNNKADAIRFLVSLNQGGLVFNENYHYYAKIQSEIDDFYDKVELSEIEFDDSNNLLKAILHLESKHTSHEKIEVSLCCENINDEIVWQTQLVKIAIPNGINTDDEIENNYPSVLAQLQKQIDELKQQGGGGLTEVEIKRIWLTYDDKKSVVANTYGYVNWGEEENKRFVNDSTRIWVNFETTPINSKMEEEIKNGRFIIRLDYPNKTRHANLISEAPTTHQATRPNGVGARSYAYSFSAIKNSEKKNILLRSLIFVNESDIKVNGIGEKYIHKKITLADYIMNTLSCDNFSMTPITNEFINNDENGKNLFDDFIDVFGIGIPATVQVGSLLEEDASENLYMATTPNNFSSTYSNYSGNIGRENGAKRRTNTRKLNPAFNCFCLFKTSSDYGSDRWYLKSPYYPMGSQRPMGLREFVNGSGYYECDSKRFNYMIARPRCAILNDDYETNEKSFLRTYPQAKQQIRVVCKVIKKTNNYGFSAMPIFRTFVTQK